MNYHVRRHGRPALLLGVLACFLFAAACGETPAAAGIKATDMPVATPAATQEPPAKTPAPTPTPTPTPIPVSYMGAAEADALLLEQESVLLCRLSSNRIRLYTAPDPEAETVDVRNNRTLASRSELIVLDEATAGDGTLFYHVRTAFDGTEGYVRADQTRASELAAEGATGFALMQRPGCAVYSKPDTASKVFAREDYHAVRVLGAYRGFSYVVTQDGVYGYVDPAQLRMTTREEIARYLAYGTISVSGEPFSPAAFADAAEALAGERATSTEALLLDVLTQAGLYFSPGYYRHFVKPLGDATLYPQGLYQAPVYNSLLFRLWNSAGNLVLCDGQETEWAYIADYADVQRGDLLFFAEYDPAETAVVMPYEVVLRGPDSGYVTACGVALGDDRMLTVEDGVAVIVEDVSASAQMPYFDCARRIHPTVTDEKAHLIEMLIAAIYDRLGTPYHNIRRTGDGSYDCSGIVCWGMRTMNIRRFKRDDGAQMVETTASGLANIDRYYRGDQVIEAEKINDALRVLEDIPRLERGDLVFLYSETASRIGHVMVYLGDGNVIHSTTVSEEYQGTLVAGFRQELQALYACARRITSIADMS